MGWSRSLGSSSSATLFPLWNTQNPWPSPWRESPQAAKTFSFQATVAVISAGACGRVMKTRFRPRFRS